MATMRPEMTELEGCPQCAGRLAEALDASGLEGGCGCADRDGCGCGEACACAQPVSRSRNPSG